MIDILIVFKWIDKFINKLTDALITFFRLRDIFLADIELGEGEEILHITFRHWGVLLVQLALPVVLMVFAGILAFYRGIGGTFLVINMIPPELAFDLVNRLLVGALGLLLALLIYSQWRAPKQQRYRQILLIIGVGLGLLLGFRLQGGRVFNIDPFSARPFDLLNLLLIGSVVANFIWTIYIFVNWANDQLILTNRRIILEDEVVYIPKLIERKSREELEIDNVQNVSSKTDTYLHTWFNYGAISIQSASVEGDKLQFDAARDPKAMQSQIDGLVKKLRNQQTKQDYARMIDEQVYNIPATKPERIVPEKTIKGPLIIRHMLEENPKFDPDKGEYTWHPHWIFLFQGLSRPLLVLFISLFAIFASVRFGILSGGWFLFSLIFTAFVLFVWILWEIEDHRNDKYIITPTNIIDIEKIPIGPEKRVTASIGALQNVSSETTFVGNLMGYGNVTLTTAGAGTNFSFRGVPNPDDVVKIVNKYRNEFKQGEKERNLKEILTVIRHYHDAQHRHNELRTEQP